MKKDLTELVFILDESGSMSGMESDVIGGFNSLIEKEKNEKGTALVTTVMFSSDKRKVHSRVDIKEVKKLTPRDYTPNGLTALLDTIGSTVNEIHNRHLELPDSEVPEKTMVIITTDGYENASSSFTYPKINQLIKNMKEKYNWDFIFLASNIDVEVESEKLGIGREYSIKNESSHYGTRKNFEDAQRAIRYCRSDKKLDRSWKE